MTCPPSPSGRAGGRRFAGRALRLVLHVDVDLLLQPRRNIDHAVHLLLKPREVVFLAHTVRLQAGVEVLRVVLAAAGHPRRGLHARAGDVVVGVLLVVPARVVGDDDIGFQQAEQEDEPLPQFAAGDVVHHVIVIVQVIDLADAEDLGQRLVVAQVRADGFGIVAGAGHVVVGHADQVRRGALVDQLCQQAGGEDGNVVRVRLDGQHHLAGARLPLSLPFNDDRTVGIEGFAFLLGVGQRGKGQNGEKPAAVHLVIVTCACLQAAVNLPSPAPACPATWIRALSGPLPHPVPRNGQRKQRWPIPR